MAQQLTEREDNSLARRILRRISGKPIHVKRFETDPHGMRRIGETAASERVPEKQVAVFVMDSRNGDVQSRKNCNPDAEDDEEGGDHHKRPAFCQAG